MDPITHAALGATCSQIALGKYNRIIPWQVGAIAAMAPDLDFFIRFKNDSMSAEYWHRLFSHSFLFIPLGGLLVALFFLCFQPYRRSWKITIAAAIIGYATHGLLDALTSYGTVLLWPFSMARISWDVIAIIYPLFSIALILGLVWTVLLKDQRGVLIGLFCAALIMLYNGYQHYRALNSISIFAQQQHLNLKSIRAMPMLASSTYWRGVAVQDQCLLYFDIYNPLFLRNEFKYFDKVPLFNSALVHLTSQQNQELKTFLWFTDNYAVVAQDTPLTLGDGRYTLGSKPIYSLWGIEILPDVEHVQRVNNIILSKHCGD